MAIPKRIHLPKILLLILKLEIEFPWTETMATMFLCKWRYDICHKTLGEAVIISVSVIISKTTSFAEGKHHS